MIIKIVQRLEAKSPLVVELNSSTTGFTYVGTSSINECYYIGTIIDLEDIYGDK